jgi:arabinose-5-phosphate isomerase
MISGPIKMKKNDYINIGKEVIDLQIKALKKLKNSIDDSFIESVKLIGKCKSKVIICGVGKSGIIASKISATLSSVGTPSFVISASDCSHGDLGKIEINDVLILISNSGNTDELKNIIKYAKVNKIKLICIVSNKNSYLYRSSDIKMLIPEVQEAGLNIVPTSSTTSQLALGDALSIALMRKKNFSKLDFKKFHPSGNLANKLKTAYDVMLSGNKIPFVNENTSMKKALKLLNSKKLGFIVVVNSQKITKGIFTDGDLKRLIQKNKIYNNLKIKQFIKKNPYAVEENTLAYDVLKQMNRKKITSIIVYNKKNINKTIGVIHIHNLLNIFK